MTTFTPEDLLLFLYKESSPALTGAIEQALQEDWTLREKMAVLKDAHERMERLLTAPRTASVMNILNYARNTEPITAHE